MRSPAMTLPGDLASRCPYCVTGDEFSVMETNDQTKLCSRCGHTVRVSDSWFHCYCPNCLRLYQEK